MASLISTIGDLLLCPVCKEVLRQPRTLPCQHSLCHECLKTLITNVDRLEQNHGDFPCPVCRAVTKLPKVSGVVPVLFTLVVTGAQTAKRPLAEQSHVVRVRAFQKPENYAVNERVQ